MRSKKAQLSESIMVLYSSWNRILALNYFFYKIVEIGMVIGQGFTILCNYAHSLDVANIIDYYFIFKKN